MSLRKMCLDLFGFCIQKYSLLSLVLNRADHLASRSVLSVGHKTTWAAPLCPIMSHPGQCPEAPCRGQGHPKCLTLEEGLRVNWGGGGVLFASGRQRRNLEWVSPLNYSWSCPCPPHFPRPPWECRAETRACFHAGQRATQVQQWRKKQGRMPRFSWWNSTSCSRSVKRVCPSSMLK